MLYAPSHSLTGNLGRGGVLMPVLRHRGSAFTPTSIAGLLFWITTPIAGLNNNDPVPMWEDDSGQNNDSAQADSGKQPTYKTNILNSLPGVLFDGSADLLTIANLPSIGTTYTAFVVMRREASAAYTLLGNEMQYVLLDNGADLATHDTSNFVNVAHGGITQGTPYLLAVRRSGTSCKFYKNGAQIGTEQTLATNNSNTLKTVGARQDGSLAFPGYIFEAAVYDSALSDENIDAFDAYALAKWGL